MAKFRLTATKDIAGSTVKRGDTIVVEAPHESWLNTALVRKALEEQLGRRLNCNFSDYNGEWTITKLS